MSFEIGSHFHTIEVRVSLIFSTKELFDPRDALVLSKLTDILCSSAGSLVKTMEMVSSNTLSERNQKPEVMILKAEFDYPRLKHFEKAKHEISQYLSNAKPPQPIQIEFDDVVVHSTEFTPSDSKQIELISRELKQPLTGKENS